MMRTMLESLIGDKNAGVNRSLKTHLDAKYLMAFTKFHEDSFYWNHLLNLDGILPCLGPFLTLFSF